MLDVKRNRLDYGRLLIPPEGFTLRQAVATSYSVDLDTLLSIPIALYYAQTLEGELQGKDVQMIRAIQHTARLLTVYHQEGQVRVPHAAKEIYAYFEDALVPILPKNAFSSFHPKMWVLRYECQDTPGDLVYRLIVLSRNLTFDRNWDVAAYLEGKPDSQSHLKNQPLIDFLKWLNGQTAFANSSSFLDELSRVKFAKADDFDEYKFHPIGIPGYEANPIATRTADRLMCLSPFLHPQALATLTQNCRQALLVLSCRYELERIPEKVLNAVQSYCLSDAVVDGERLSSAEEGDTEPLDQDLHAKVFLLDHAKYTTWFLGSANATKAAFERNVEFMLELKGSKPATRLDRVRKQLLGNDEGGNLFTVFLPSEGGHEDEEEQRRRTAIRKLEYAILRARIRGDVRPSANEENYDSSLTLDFRGIVQPRTFAVEVRPFVVGVDEQVVRMGLVNTLLFANITETSLSRFLHVAIREGDQKICEFLVRVAIEGIPSTRLDNIFRSIINNRDKFFTYLRFLLTDELSKEDLEGVPAKVGKHETNGPAWNLDMPIFEQLLVTASRNPHRLIEVDRVIASLRETDGDGGDGVIPQDFFLLWEIFKAAVPQVEGEHE